MEVRVASNVNFGGDVTFCENSNVNFGGLVFFRKELPKLVSPVVLYKPFLGTLSTNHKKQKQFFSFLFFENKKND